MAAVVYTCRICMEESNSREGFIVPCQCRGTALYVHRECLDTWRSQDPNGQNFRRCNTCHFQYELTNTEQNSLVEAQRIRAYKKAVAIDVALIVFYLILIVFVLAFILYWLDVSGLVPIRPYMAKKLRITNAWIGFTVVSLGLILLGIGIYGLFNMESVAWDGMDAVAAVTMVGLNPTLWLSMGVMAGAFSGFYNVGLFLDSSRRKHRQRIWLHREAQIRTVRDFGDIGPVAV